MNELHLLLENLDNQDDRLTRQLCAIVRRYLKKRNRLGIELKEGHRENRTE